MGLGRTFKGHLVQPLCTQQRPLQLEQAAQSSIQPELEWFQAWTIYHLSAPENKTSM